MLQSSLRNLISSATSCPQQLPRPSTLTQRPGQTAVHALPWLGLVWVSFVITTTVSAPFESRTVIEPGSDLTTTPLILAFSPTAMLFVVGAGGAGGAVGVVASCPKAA